jgi:DNA invertase Pin-like site-specific DNA recombinase
MTQQIFPPVPGLRSGAPVLGYVSAARTEESSGTDPSQRAIETACTREGWELLDVLYDAEQRRTLKRPNLLAGLQRIADGEARGLVVSDARLLGHSIVDLAPLLSWFREARVALVALDLGLDTSTPRGMRVAMALIRLSGWERGTPMNGNGHNGNGHNGNGNGRPFPALDHLRLT